MQAYQEAAKKALTVVAEQTNLCGLQPSETEKAYVEKVFQSIHVPNWKVDESIIEEYLWNPLKKRAISHFHQAKTQTTNTAHPSSTEDDEESEDVAEEEEGDTTLCEEEDKGNNSSGGGQSLNNPRKGNAAKKRLPKQLPARKRTFAKSGGQNPKSIRGRKPGGAGGRGRRGRGKSDGSQQT
mmetsp:Transcript_11223/g.25987  ORF Transcript_11223/g.25987 Transcript_11223/m.25987 type:complete len:182 (+) Transcript_11223:298-843(+)